MNYSRAITLVKKHKALTRQAWPNEVYICEFDPVGSGVETISIRGVKAPLKNFIVMRNYEGMYAPYYPTPEDMKATDWEEVEH